MEALFSIIVALVKNKKYQMMFVLHGLTLLDGHHTMVSMGKQQFWTIQAVMQRTGSTN
jgi:hypothetical protein